MSRYKVLAETIIGAIDEGKLQLNDKMLSLRAFSQQHQVSMTTAVNCYDYLQDRGYLVSRPKSGYFIQQPIPVQQQPALPQFVGQVSANDGIDTPVDFHPFATAQLSEALLPSQDMQKSFSHFAKTMNASALQYGNEWGSDELRSALAGHFSKQGFAFTPDELLIQNGCLDAVRMAVECISHEGDTIAVASPCFSGLLNILRLLNRKILEIPSTENGLDLLQLTSLIRHGQIKALLVTANFQNPLGRSLSNEQKQALAELANQFHFPIIEDDVYAELGASSHLPLPIKYWDRGGDVIWCSSFSKTLSASFRVGWCLPGRHFDAMKMRRKVETLSVNLPLQYILADFINTGKYAKHLSRIKVMLQGQLAAYRGYLFKRINAPLAVSSPVGGLVLWCQVAGMDAGQLTKKLAAHGIGIRPGNLFSTRDFYGDYFRLNCGWPLSEDKKKQLDVVCELINESN